MYKEMSAELGRIRDIMLELKIENKELKKENDKLQEQLDTKIMFVNNGMEEEHYALQEKVIRYEKTLRYYADRGFKKASEVLE